MESKTQEAKIVSWEDAVTWLVQQPEHRELVQQCYFDRPVSQAVRRYAASAEWQAILPWLPNPVGQAFDLGAGNGIVSYALAKEGWHVTALEPDPSEFVGAGAIRELASQENLNIQVVEEFGESIPFPSNTFDLAMARQVIHHAKNLNQMYAELSRILKPGGRLIAFRDHIVDSEAGLEEFRRSHPLHKLYGGENAFSLAEYKQAIRLAGLKIDKELHQFESVINFAPKSKAEICRAICEPVRIPFLKKYFASLLASPLLFAPMMKLSSKLFRRPGRLVSFVCSKPA